LKRSYVIYKNSDARRAYEKKEGVGRDYKINEGWTMFNFW
jgi:hypothetical protein